MGVPCSNGCHQQLLYLTALPLSLRALEILPPSIHLTIQVKIKDFFFLGGGGCSLSCLRGGKSENECLCCYLFVKIDTGVPVNVHTIELLHFIH